MKLVSTLELSFISNEPFALENERHVLVKFVLKLLELPFCPMKSINRGRAGGTGSKGCTSNRKGVRNFGHEMQSHSVATP